MSDNLGKKQSFRLGSISTWRERPASALSAKFTNMKPDFRMSRVAVPRCPAQPTEAPTGPMNPSGRVAF